MAKVRRGLPEGLGFVMGFVVQGKVKATFIKFVSTAGTGWVFAFLLRASALACELGCRRFFYTARKNPSAIQHKLGFMKVGGCAWFAACIRVTCSQYDPVVRQHVLFTEVRISRAKK
jgi:ribosomal protein L33